MRMDEIKVSIITVCRNAAETITKTIDSVLNQEYTNFEYIVVDGNSSDETYTIVKNYEKFFKKRNIQFKCISESDNGIFDAMNKAVRLTSGEWINFMNADDEFYSKLVLKKIFKSNNNFNSFDVIYGDTLRVNQNHEYILSKAKKISTITKAMPFCHQSSFIRSQVQKSKKFSLDYRVADYNLFLRTFLEGGRFCQLNLTIAKYSMLGYSNQNKYLTYLSTVDIKHDNGLLNKHSLAQYIRNIYFYFLLRNVPILSPFIKRIDRMVKKREIL